MRHAYGKSAGAVSIFLTEVGENLTFGLRSFPRNAGDPAMPLPTIGAKIDF